METKEQSGNRIISQLKTILEPWVTTPELLEQSSGDIDLISDLGLDSIGILQIILGIEKTFGISIANYELDAEILTSLNTLSRLIERKLNAVNRFAEKK